MLAELIRLAAVIPTMEFIAASFIGLLAGIVAKLLMPGRDPGGFIVIIALGIGGALLATWIAQLADWYRADDSAGFVGAAAGAILTVLAYRLAGWLRDSG